MQKRKEEEKYCRRQGNSLVTAATKQGDRKRKKDRKKRGTVGIFPKTRKQ